MRFRSKRRDEVVPDSVLEPIVENVSIKDDVIRLGQFLKLANLVDSGADAKAVIAEGDVMVNGEGELRRGRQLRPDDVVEFQGRRARVTHGDGDIDVPW
jgi:ribosome-associated protein